MKCLPPDVLLPHVAESTTYFPSERDFALLFNPNDGRAGDRKILGSESAVFQVKDASDFLFPFLFISFDETVLLCTIILVSLTNHSNNIMN